jgi:hypothetical protein
MILAPIFQPKITEILGMLHSTGRLAFLARDEMRYHYPHSVPLDTYPRTNTSILKMTLFMSPIHLY